MLHARIIEKKTGNRSFTYYAGKTPWKMPATSAIVCCQASCNSCFDLSGFFQAMTDPAGCQLFLDAVLAQSRCQSAEIDLVERLILIEAGEYVGDLSGLGVLVRLQALRANFFHHALHG